MIADWIHHELLNWGRWCHQGPWPHPIPPDHAASAEGRYVAPSDLGEPPDPKPIPPNRQRAEVVHRVYREQLTNREQGVLLLRYIKPTPFPATLRRLRINRREYDVALIAAARCVGEAFREERIAVRA